MDQDGPALHQALTASPEETRRLGRLLSGRLDRNGCVALYGDLGSGKTCLVQGICQGFGVSEPVTSPTFVLISEYLGLHRDGRPVEIFHFDLYRLGGPDELIDLGWDDYLRRGGLCLVEWADRAADLVPCGAVRVRIEPIDRERRQFTFSYGA